MTPIIKFIKKLLRRTRTKSKPIDSSYIIPRSQHRISKSNISGNALKVLNRLSSSGFDAYLVGGSVRDLLLGKVPKDFDIATNATPAQVKKLFRNARIIGRRFKLVHVVFAGNREIIEVATFRGNETDDDTHQKVNERGMIVRDNVYGNLNEDSWRRDLSVNSLYYNIEDASIIDFTGGVADVQKRIIRIIGAPDTRYQEDPVRMLRVIRFAARLHFTIDDSTAAPLGTLNHLITHVSSSRLFDEMTKLYHCGEAESAHNLLLQHGFFEALFEQTYQSSLTCPSQETLINFALESTDTRIHENKPVNPAFLYAVFLWFPLKAHAAHLQESQNLAPLAALEAAMNDVILKQVQRIAIPKRYTQIMREIWLLQFRFLKRSGTRAQHLLEHPRFRAAYDFMALRALAKDESMELATWWTHYQDADETQKAELIATLPVETALKKRKRRKPKPPIP